MEPIFFLRYSTNYQVFLWFIFWFKKPKMTEKKPKIGFEVPFKKSKKRGDDLKNRNSTLLTCWHPSKIFCTADICSITFFPKKLFFQTTLQFFRKNYCLFQPKMAFFCLFWSGGENLPPNKRAKYNCTSGV